VIVDMLGGDDMRKLKGACRKRTQKIIAMCEVGRNDADESLARALDTDTKDNSSVRGWKER
jgi:hypothetical protein